jgi:hypothetical protein
MKFLQPNKIDFSSISDSIRNWLIETYSQANSVFSKSSPFGQILAVMQEFAQLMFFYIEDSLVELNIYTATKQRSIYSWARLTGHNPTRSLSAQGTLSIKIKPGSEIPPNAAYALLLDKTKMKCTTNNKKYFVNLGNDLSNLKIDLKSPQNIYSLKIVQGELETQTLVGNGNPLQSFSIQSKSVIENEMVWVTVNGENYEVVDSLYDMTKDDKMCLVKTGLSGGIDIYFGNEDFGTIPPLGSTINVMYVKTDGFEGNIYSKSNTIEFKFEESGYTNIGDEIDFNNILSITIEKPVILGADSELPELTKLIAPKTSRSYVLANPDNYVNYLSRFNYSYVDAYTTHEDDYIADDNVVYLFIIPDLSRRLLKNTDYFTTNIENFYLDENEKNDLIDFIDMSGKQIITTELQVVDPEITRYVMNVFLRIYDTADQVTLKTDIINKISDYLLKVKRRDKIPKSDLIAVIENITGVDSVNISFISEKNERAIIDGFYYKKIKTIDGIRGLTVFTEEKVILNPGDDPNIGLDEFGDISIGLNELPVIRGGSFGSKQFYDRFGNYYEDGISDSQYSSVNIIIKDVIRESLTVKMMNSNKNSIK